MWLISHDQPAGLPTYRKKSFYLFVGQMWVFSWQVAEIG
jgi:hypothetical protein